MTAMDEYQDIRDLLKPKRNIEASEDLKNRIKKETAPNRLNSNRTWFWGGASAAACIAIVLGIGLNQGISDNDCIAYVEGKKASKETALKIAEADVAKMELFMETVAAHKANEDAKVQQFMNHKTQRK